MINLEPNRRAAATFTTSGPVTGAKTAQASKSFETQLSEAVSGSAAAARSGAPGTAAARREFAAVRQIPVASGASKLETAAAGATAEIAAHNGDSAAPVTANSPMAAPAGSAPSGSSGASSSSAAPPPTPQQVVANLLAQNAPPQPYSQAQQPSTNPAVYEGGGYMQQSNLNCIEQQAGVQNRNLFANYTVAVQNWAGNGMRGSPPAAPKYESVDVNGFNQWWSEYTSNLGAGRRPQISRPTRHRTMGTGARLFSRDTRFKERGDRRLPPPCLRFSSTAPAGTSLGRNTDCPLRRKR